MNNLKAEDYKPKEKGISDFYSWNLYRWLRKQDSDPEIFKKNKIYKSNEGDLYIGTRYGGNTNDHVTGVRLRALCSGSSVGKFPICGSWIGSNGWEDVTETFIAEYNRIGVCAIHGYMAHDWEYGGSLRGCKHCEKVERKKIKMVEVVSWEES